MIVRSLALMLVASCISINAQAASSKDVEQMTFFAIKLGRAVACQIQAGEEASRKVGLWFGRKFLPAEQSEYMMTFSSAILLAAKRQRSGESVEPCGDVAKYFDSQEFQRALSR
jgi:hypothetical protein